ncbi:hypothetical protein BKA93DRAFT_732805, partial [Sparassis latifolia]
YYGILSIPPSASAAEIKQAYHQALLLSHPDKHHAVQNGATPPAVDIGLLKEAYTTLSSPALRIAYDAVRMRARAPQTGPRPAQVVSLEEFDEGEGADAVWSYACRCGGKYVIGEKEMDAGQHLVGCNSCSEVVWVGYELTQDDSDEVRH